MCVCVCLASSCIGFLIKQVVAMPAPFPTTLSSTTRYVNVCGVEGERQMDIGAPKRRSEVENAVNLYTHTHTHNIVVKGGSINSFFS